MLANAYFLAKFRFDTAENEPAKNLQNFRKIHFSKNAFFENAFFENAVFENANNKPRPTPPCSEESREVATYVGSHDCECAAQLFGSTTTTADTSLPNPSFPNADFHVF